MKARRLLVLPALALLASPLLTGPSDAAVGTAPVFRQYHAPGAPLDVRGNRTKGDASGEPSLGFDSRTGDVMYMAEKATFRVHGFDLARAERATWDDVTDPVIGAQTSDPILYTDPVTHRTWANQLELQGGSLQAYTDDEGKTWTHSTMGGAIGLAFDHQTIVAGKRVAEAAPFPAPIGYPDYLYYCTNDLYAANCAVSVDGGLNFLAALPVYTGELAGGPCTAIFGHIKTDPRDGTVYLPPNGCNGKQMLFTSRDNTFSWTGSVVPGSTDGDAGHPSVGVGRQDGAVYYAWGSADGSNGTGRIHTAVSRDHGRTWVDQRTLGADLGVVTSRFPVVVAGDRGRAAVAFLGAKVPGDPNLAPDPTTPSIKPYKGVWDLYVSFTLDGGKSWKTYDATPHDPVQRGPVCTRGTTCLAGRNLLDFNDMVLDASGHVVIAMADGALKPGDDYRQDLSKATIVRQVGGPSLYASNHRPG
ncbi:MAG: sialidase family protein [Mycobacteriales bacterium]